MQGDIRSRTMTSQKKIEGDYGKAMNIDKLVNISPELDEVVILLQKVDRRYDEIIGEKNSGKYTEQILKNIQVLKTKLDKDYADNWAAYERYGWEIKHDPVYEIVRGDNTANVQIAESFESLMKDMILPMEADLYSLVDKLEKRLETIASIYERVCKELEVAQRENRLGAILTKQIEVST